MNRRPDRLEKPALLLVDVINRFEFPGAAQLVRAAERAAPRIRALAERARRARVPVIYVNDHFGQWRSDFAATVDGATRTDSKGRLVATELLPVRADYFVLKPLHSGFYATPLAPLLESLKARTLVLTGFAADYCIEFTANDAYMRGYRIVVPRDCTAANTPQLTQTALEHVRTTLKGDTPVSTEVSFRAPARRKS